MPDTIYDVPLIPQPTKTSCWAACMAMLVSYRDSVSISPEQLAATVGRSLRESCDWDLLESVKDSYGIYDVELPSNQSLYPSPEQWWEWLETYGPLWVTIVGTPSHAIVVRGISGDLTTDNTIMYVNNPWDLWTTFSDDEVDFDPPNTGYAYERAFPDFAADFGLMDLADYGRWRLLYIASPEVGGMQGTEEEQGQEAPQYG